MSISSTPDIKSEAYKFAEQRERHRLRAQEYRDLWRNARRVRNDLIQEYERERAGLDLLDEDLEAIIETISQPYRNQLEAIHREIENGSPASRTKNGGFGRLFSLFGKQRRTGLKDETTSLRYRKAYLEYFLSDRANLEELAGKRQRLNRQHNRKKTAHLEPMRLRIKEYDLIVRAIEAGSEPVAMAAIRGDLGAMLSAAAIWDRLDRGDPVSDAEKTAYWDLGYPPKKDPIQRAIAAMVNQSDGPKPMIVDAHFEDVSEAKAAQSAQKEPMRLIEAVTVSNDQE
ncbi:hypothetical protein [Thalassospira xiamenensis]|uniref:Uncharacterized protein n=1 Tax=Thalassospira xiamenensis TaxID=220697 RepID=A0A285TY81_9PROT|nr:hypothetical protein [Thalassospira xiamenensis]SOC30558.1 hypothetical protein SAMN05428964_109106 [Thalassospira xiamenensis]